VISLSLSLSLSTHETNHWKISKQQQQQIYDCDFNQQLGYAIGVDSIHRGGKTVFDINSLDDLRDARIRTDNHCFGCTAGMGSSWQGATA